MAVIALMLALFLLLQVVSLKRQVNELRDELHQRNNWIDDTTSASAPLNPTAPGGFADGYGDELSPELEDRLRELVRQGKKIVAIKELRMTRNLSLAEAKRIVDRLEQR
ncbi:hypothetical protein PA598K_02010 [Paenibacillus sp. 598K]|uniref:hypothetical protein n=1 Tax=Paenibacillus sp. 598K TaxID=1117987 RepID=UPI000FF94200|nr:hypothetical protein [Paenibacillus sp. 598K]GBF73699.1 hypothetical protein PA598K_02010 [Paenibacillus sp. 598K]